MNNVRKRILKEVEDANYTDFWKHSDLIAFCVCEADFCYNPETDEEEESDFNEVLVVVEKKWLFNLIKQTEEFKTDEDVRRFLQEDYTSDDSKVWFEEAVLAKKIVAIDFN